MLCRVLSGGMQDIFYGIREKTRNIADHHANLARTVDMSIVQHLHKLRTEIKAHIKNIQMDTGKLAVVSSICLATLIASYD